MTTALVCVEGVLGEESTIHGFYPIVEGLRFIRALREGYEVMLSTIQANVDSVEYWLKVNGLVKPSHYEELWYRERKWVGLRDTEVRMEQLHFARAAGYDLGLFVSADAEAVLGATEAGVLGLMFAHPSYRWSEFRQDHKKLPRLWQHIEDEVTKQRELKATDPRLLEDQHER